jgi:hypothetical protein
MNAAKLKLRMAHTKAAAVLDAPPREFEDGGYWKPMAIRVMRLVVCLWGA